MAQIIKESDQARERDLIRKNPAIKPNLMKKGGRIFGNHVTGNGNAPKD